MNRVKSFYRSAKEVAQNAGKKAAVVLGATVAGTQMAMAQAVDLGAAATTELSGAKATVGGILLILVGIAFLFVLYHLIKRAK